MPVIKKNNPKKVTAPSFNVDDEVLVLDEGEEKRGIILEINDDRAIIQIGEDQYDESLNDIKLAPPEEKAEPTEKARLAARLKRDKIEVEPTPAKTGSLASLLKNAKAAPDGGGNGFPPGTWEAILVGADTELDKAGNNCGVFYLVGVSDQEVLGKKARVSYQIQLSTGEEGPGMEYFKRDLLKLGVDLDNINDDDDLDIALKALAEEENWIEVTAKPQSKQPQFTNVFINGLKENQEDKPEVPTV